MKFGYSIPNNRGVEDPNDLVALAVEAEAMGFASVWVAEHLFHATYVAERLGDRPYHDALTVLTAAAMATKTVKLGTSVLVLPWHDPARLGKMVATLDHLSKGRVVLGVGVATTEDEFENLGVDFKSRGRRTNEVLGALQALWTQDVPEFSGEFFNYKGLKFSPKPYQKPYPPILIGGGSGPAFRRIVKYGDGWHTLRQSPNRVAEGRQRIVQLMAEAGRDVTALRYSISIQTRFDAPASDKAVADRTTLQGTAADMIGLIHAYEDVGLQEMVVGFGESETDGNRRALARFGDEVMAKL
jgi:probable F420-dependent oxidoreductase